jgi:hypothetical protein
MLSVENKHNMLSIIMLNVVMLSVVMLNVVRLSVVILNVVMLSVVAPLKGLGSTYNPFRESNILGEIT